jgi:hypothetical protein
MGPRRDGRSDEVLVGANLSDGTSPKNELDRVFNRPAIALVFWI